MGLTLDGRANPRRLASGTLPRASHDAPKPALCKAPHITPPGPLASPLALNSASADSLPQAPKSSGLRPGPSPPAASDEALDIFRDVARQPELLLSALGSIDRDSRGWPFESDLKLVLTHWQRLRGARCGAGPQFEALRSYLQNVAARVLRGAVTATSPCLTAARPRSATRRSNECGLLFATRRGDARSERVDGR